MPIRFRCVYCDKLLGIARRKAGAVVNCPQCGQPLIVPTPEGEPEKAVAASPSAVPSAPATIAASPSGNLFERDDFDVVLQSDVTVQGNEPAPPPMAPKRPKSPKPQSPPPVPSPLPPRPFAVEQSLPPPPRDGFAAPLPLPVRQRPSGMVLTTGKLILALAVVLFLVVAAFGGGVVVGRLMTQAASGSSTSHSE